MKAFAKSDLPDRAKQALKLLQGMKSKADIHKVRPNAITYSTCIYAFALSNEMDRVEMAESLLQELIDKYQEFKTEEMKPSRDTWSVLILTHAYSASENRVERAMSIIKRIIDFGMNPVNSHYNIILLACSLDAKLIGNETEDVELDNNLDLFLNSQEDKLRSSLCQVVYKVMNAFDQEVYGISPDSVTFANLLTCSSLFSDADEADRFIIRTFDRCKEKGLVDDRFINLLRERVPRSLSLENLLPGDDGKNFVIPPQWSKAVKSRKFIRREERKSPKYDDGNRTDPSVDEYL